MGKRSHLLWQISKALKEHDIDLNCESIAQLNQSLPGLMGRSLKSLKGLEELLGEIAVVSKQTIVAWQQKPVKQPKITGRDLDVCKLKKAGTKVEK